MTETQWTKLVCGALPALFVPYVASRRQPSGYPDRIVWSRRWVGWVEFKGPETRLEKAQELRMRQLNAIVPGSAFVWRAGEGYDGSASVEYCSTAWVGPRELWAGLESGLLDATARLAETLEV